jgi:hypothetical protein
MGRRGPFVGRARINEAGASLSQPCRYLPVVMEDNNKPERPTWVDHVTNAVDLQIGTLRHEKDHRSYDYCNNRECSENLHHVASVAIIGVLLWAVFSSVESDGAPWSLALFGLAGAFCFILIALSAANSGLVF